MAQFQGQAFGEQANGWTRNPNSSEQPAKPPATLAQAILAGPSRLTFRMPNLTAELPLSLADFLDACRNWPTSLGSLAAPLPPNFSDDLPTGSGFDRITDFIGMSGAAVASVLAGARIFPGDG